MKRIRGKCKFCGSRQNLMWCKWRVEMGKPWKADYQWIGEGDFVETIGIRHKQARKYWAKVLSAVGLQDKVVMYGLQPTSEMNYCPLNFLADGEEIRICNCNEHCGAITCEVHRREIDENICYCEDHWDAWEDLA